MGQNSLDSFHGFWGASIPIVVPPFHDIAPRLTLAYTTSGQSGQLGQGFSLSGFDLIERVSPGRGAPSYSDSDNYALGGEELIPCAQVTASPGCQAIADGTLGFATKIESYSRVRLDTTTGKWTVTQKSGTATTYAPIYRVGDGQVFRWGIESVQDTNHNVVHYSWWCDGERPVLDCYPDQISYGQGGYALVQIYRELRPDVLPFANGSSGSAAYVGQTRFRTTTIEVRAGGNRARAFRLSYQTSAALGHSLITSIRQYGTDAVLDGSGRVVGGTSLPATTFSYTGEAVTMEHPDWWLEWPADQSAGYDTVSNCLERAGCRNAVVDVNADGKMDLILTNGDISHPATAWDVLLSTGHGFTKSSSLSFPAGLSSPALTGVTNSLRDVNGDGKMDLITRDQVGGNMGFSIWLSDGTGFVFSSHLDDPPGLQAGLLEGSVNSVRDIDGDGRADLITLDKQTGVLGYSIWLSNGSSFVYTSHFIPPPTIADACLEGSATVGGFPCPNLLFDINGDGRVDFVSNDREGGQMGLSVYLSDGTTWILKKHFNFPAGIDQGFPMLTNKVADFTGDGKADLLLHDTAGSGNAGWSLYVWTDALGWDSTLRSHLDDPTGLYSRWIQGACNSAVDFNADGKVDLILLDQMGSGNLGYSVYLNTGGQFVYASHMDLPAFVIDAGLEYGGSGNIIADFNGDGLPDLLMTVGSVADPKGTADSKWGWHLYWSDGTRFVDNTDTLWLPNHPSCVAGQPCPAYVSRFHSQALRGDSNKVADFTGDGKPDILVTLNDTGGSDNDFGPWGFGLYVNTFADPANRLHQEVGSLGAVATLTYQPQPIWSLHGPFVQPVVSAVETQDGRGGDVTKQYEYCGGLFDAVERRFLGFRYVKQILPTVPGEGAAPSIETWFRQDYGSLSKPEDRKVWSSGGSLLTYMHAVFWTNGSDLPYRSLEVGHWEYSFGEGDCPGSGCRRTYLSRSHDEYANVTHEQYWGDADAIGDEKNSVTLFRPSLTPTSYIVDHPAVVRTYTGLGENGAQLGETLYSYDGATTWDQPPSQGNRTATDEWLFNPISGQQSYLHTTASYDPSNGNAIVLSDANGVATTITYDATGVLMASLTRAAGRDEAETSSTSWDHTCIAEASTTDPNLQTTATSYDALCRPSQVTGPLGTFTRYNYVDFGNPDGQFVETVTPPADQFVAGAENSWTRNYFDGLGRTWRSASIGPGGDDDRIATETRYDGRGNPFQQSAPYYATSGFAPAPGEGLQWSTRVFDPLGRVTQAILPDGASSSTRYGAREVTATDLMGHVQQNTSNAYGSVVQHDETVTVNGVATTYSSKYLFDLYNRLVQTTDPAGNRISISYDSLGRRLLVSDPDHGDWRYAYDATNRLLVQSDAKGQVTQYSYDGLGRMLTKTSLAGTDQATQVSWRYDESRRAADGTGYFNRGRRTTMTDAAGSETYNHDALGRLVDLTRTIDGTSYGFQNGFDSNGHQIWSHTLFDDDWVGKPTDPLRYDRAGRLRQIPAVVDDASYNAAGQLTQLVNHNGTTTTRTYSGSRKWLMGISTPGMQNDSYQRDPEGKMLTRTSSVDDQTDNWVYSYDALHRLTQASLNGTVAQQVDYDGSGNVISNSRLGSYTYPAPGSPHPHAVTQAGPNSYAYDPNGAMISGAGRTFSYDGDGRLSGVGGGL
jgi:YD repeat-containing protein